MTEDPRKTKTKVHFGCGFLFGILGGGGGVLFLFEDARENWLPITITLFWALVCGALSARFGERFWEGLATWWTATRGGGW